MRRSGSRHLTAGLAVVVLAAALLAGCGDGSDGSTTTSSTTSSSTTASTTTSTAAATTTAPPTTGPSTTAGPTTTVTVPSRATGTGRVTVEFSQPFATSGSTNARVTCTGARTKHVVTVTDAHAGTAVLDLAVTTTGYHGPGTYPSTVELAVSSPLLVALPPATSVPVELTATGGSVELDGTTANGRPISGSVSWTCPT